MNFINSVMHTDSNFLPIAAAFVCVGAMAAFLLKALVVLQVNPNRPVNRSNLSPIHTLQKVPQLKMTKVHIPFTLRVIDAENSPNEIKLCTSSQINYSIQAFWGVSIRELHMSLWKTWNELCNFASDKPILERSLYHNIALQTSKETSHTDNIITLKFPESSTLLGPPPRLAYPLVVFLIRDVEPQEIVPPNETVLLVSVIHLKDTVCSLPTSILAQYLKQANGQLSSLKQLYMATGDTILNDEQQHRQSSLSMAEPVACTAESSGTLLCCDGPQLEQLCVVCQYFPLSRALLPCRHTCVCAICFAKLIRCPMCRSPITSYFCIRTEEYIPPNTLETKRTKDNVHWIDALNDRLTDFLGFR